MTTPPINTRPARRSAPRLGLAVGSQLAALAKASGALDPALITAWPEIAGPDLHSLCRPVRLIRRGKSQTLVVAVPSGAAAMRIQYAQDQLLARAASYLKLPSLKKIVIEQSGPAHAPIGAKARWASRQMTPASVSRPDAELPRQPAASVSEALARLKGSLLRRGS